MKNKISIILPCFNGEKTIDITLSSLLKLSSFSNYFEIIFINDGSTDGTEKKINDFIIRNDSFSTKLFNQSNKGLSQARNKGLELSQNDYIWFVDADDQILANNFKALIEVLDKNYELISFPVKTERGKVLSIQRNNLKLDSPKIGAQYYIYSRLFLVKNQLEFVPNLIHEDLEFLPRVFNLSPSYIYLNTPYYNRIITEGSITSSKVGLKRVLSLLEISFLHYSNYKKNITKKNNFGYYSIIALNNAILLSFKLSNQDFTDFRKFLKLNIKKINQNLSIYDFSLPKLKSFFSIILANFLIKNE